jgi:predicted Zn-dependent protease with MMP-like domain
VEEKQLGSPVEFLNGDTPKLSVARPTRALPMPLSMNQFCRIVARVMKTLPHEFYPYLENLEVEVIDESNRRLMRRLGFSEDDILNGKVPLGLFDSFSYADTPQEIEDEPEDDPQLQPDFDTPHRLLIFKQAHEEEFPDPQQLRIEIRKTVIHELAHHFGFAEKDLAKFDENPDPFGDDLAGDPTK